MTFKQFDHLIELSAAAPRSLDLAPPTDQMFKFSGARMAARKKLFDSMGADGGGTISFDGYLKYTINHSHRREGQQQGSGGAGLRDAQVADHRLRLRAMGEGGH